MSDNLSAAAVKYLRSLGRRLPARVRVGKGGMSESVVRQVGEMLTRHELVKVKVLETAGVDTAALAGELAPATRSDVAAVVGRTVLLFRPNRELPADKRIQLPD